MKCCVTCKFYRNEWGSDCTHPDFRKWDDVTGWKYLMPHEAVKECRLEKWEKRPSLLAGLAGLWRLRK
jgi:hypothetical protein